MPTTRPAPDFVALAGLIVPVTFAVAALAGWLVDLPFLRSGFGGGVAMNPMTAVALLIASAAVWGLATGSRARRFRPLVIAGGAAVIVVGAAKLLEAALGLELGLDRLLFTAKLDVADAVPNRMAPNTAIAFVLTGGAIVLLAAPGRLRRIFGRTLVIATGAGCLVVLVAHVWHNARLTGLRDAIPMAANTAASFVMLSAALAKLSFRRLAAGAEGSGSAVRHGVNIVIAAAVVILLFTGGFSVIGGVQYQEAARERKASLERQLQLSELIAGLNAADFGDSSPSARQRLTRRLAEIDSLRAAAAASAARWDQRVEANAPVPVFTNLVAVTLAALFLVLAGLAINSDMRRREDAEAAVRESERRLARIIEVIPSMVFLKEADTLRFVRLNRAGEEMLGVREADVLGKNDFELYPKEVAESYAAFDRAAAASSEVVDVPEQRVTTPHRGERVLHTRKVAVHDDDGRPLYIIGNSVDITDRLRADAALREAKDAADAANRAKSDFLAKMSHELRTPLNSIIGFSEILEDGGIGPLNEKQRRYVGNVLASGRNLLQLINDILDLSRVEAGRMDLAPMALDTASALEEARALVAGLAEKQGLELTVEVAPHTPRIHADPVRFRQIMFNLVGNAIKFTPAGGRVHISAARGEGGLVEIAVRDTGIGIAPEHQEKIFGEFEQVHDSSVTDQPGTGLGLALTRKLVELHGGGIGVESEVGRGSTFRFTVLADGADGADEADEADEADGRGGRLVLVVDDQPQARDLMSHLLIEAGYRVATSAGDDLVALARELRPDAITLDILLPGRDGLDALAELKASEETKHIPIVVVSVTDRNELGFALGAADWLVKPVDRARLLAALQRAMGPPAAASGRTVLVVDDEPAAREYAAEILSQRGFGVIAASGGRLGVELALAHRPDLVILDLMMPEMNGFDVVRELRRSPEASGIPILILTSKDLTPEEKAFLHESVSAVVTKAGAQGLLAELHRICPPDGAGAGAA